MVLFLIFLLVFLIVCRVLFVVLSLRFCSVCARSLGSDWRFSVPLLLYIISDAKFTDNEVDLLKLLVLVGLISEYDL